MHSHSCNKKEGDKNILIAFLINFCFSIVEFVGGYLTNSVAIYSDALHDLGDSVALLFSYFAEQLSHKKADAKYTFGYRRFSALSALVNGCILFVGSAYIIYEAIERINEPEAIIPEGMVVLALVGLLVNFIAAYRLASNKSINSKMLTYHFLEDILGWLSVLIVSIVLLFKPWYILDSILSILISAIILRGVYQNLIKVGAVFLQKLPEDLSIDKVKKEIMSLEKIIDVHAVKGWSFDSSEHYLRFHIVLPENTLLKDVDVIKIEIKNLLKKHNVVESTIEFESSKKDISDCDQV